MLQHRRVRYQRLLREAEGYLELGLPHLAIEVLHRLEDPGTFRSKQLFLLGQAYRAQGRFSDAVDALEASVEKTPSNIDIYVSLGWCYKRLNKVDRAIESLEKGLEIDPKEALLYYNLACYWCLAHNKDRTLAYLNEALQLSPEYRELIAAESDFDSLREDPEFQALVGVAV